MQGATLIISNKEVKDSKKLFQSPEDCGLLIKEVTQTIENEAKRWIFWYLIRHIMHKHEHMLLLSQWSKNCCNIF